MFNHVNQQFEEMICWTSPGLYILLPRWRKMTRGPSSERMAGVVGGAAAVTESETGLAPRVAKFQCEM